jgi:cytochrome P450
LQSAHEARKALVDFFAQEIAKRKASPSSDIISRMLAADFEGEKLSDDEIISQCQLLLVAGNVTTTDLIGNGVKALLDHPEQLALLCGNPHLIEAAVEEILRYDSPVINGHRVAGERTEIGGCPIDKGECLHLSLGAANHDPEIYTNPEEFLIEREHIAHQSFGGGPHHCLGASLARLEAQEAIMRIIKRFPNLRLSKKGAVQAAVPGFRGLEICWLEKH